MEDQFWVRYRFKTSSEDWRPIKYNPSYPCWETGTTWSNTEPVVELSIVVAYLPKTESLTDYWPEAEEVDPEPCSEITFTGRFPQPKDYVPLTY